MIHASCHTADDAMSVEFDATAWFREADADSIVRLARHDWASVRIAESLERLPGYEGLHALIVYAGKRLQGESLEDPGWETYRCEVSGAEAVGWLKENRPDVAAKLAASGK
jgi:hypothetical protein